MTRCSFLLAATLVATAACSAGGQRYGAVAPSRYICTLGGFHQELAVARDFRIDRPGDDAGFPGDRQVRSMIDADSASVKKYGVCPGVTDIGAFHMVLHRIEVGSSRSMGGKILAWTLFILPTLGLSSIYPMSEERWIMVELDADATVGEHKVWSGQFTSFVKEPLMKEIPTVASQVTALMVRAQESAVKDLKASMEAR